jgi:predicted transcriptional regulator
MATTTFRTDPEKLKRLDDLAKILGRSRAWLLNKAVDELLEYEEWFVGEIQKGLQDDEKENYASSEEIKAIFQKYRS